MSVNKLPDGSYEVQYHTGAPAWDYWCSVWAGRKLLKCTMNNRDAMPILSNMADADYNRAVRARGMMRRELDLHLGEKVRQRKPKEQKFTDVAVLDGWNWHAKRYNPIQIKKVIEQDKRLLSPFVNYVVATKEEPHIINPTSEDCKLIADYNRKLKKFQDWQRKQLILIFGEEFSF